MNYVVMPTNPRINLIGGIVGPFDTKELAQTYIDQAEYATPEEVLIRPLHAPGRMFSDEELDALKQINTFYRKNKKHYEDDIPDLILEIKRFSRREFPGMNLPEFVLYVDEEVIRFVRD